MSSLKTNSSGLRFFAASVALSIFPERGSSSMACIKSMMPLQGFFGSPPVRTEVPSRRTDCSLPIESGMGALRQHPYFPSGAWRRTASSGFAQPPRAGLRLLWLEDHRRALDTRIGKGRVSPLIVLASSPLAVRNPSISATSTPGIGCPADWDIPPQPLPEIHHRVD